MIKRLFLCVFVKAVIEFLVSYAGHAETISEVPLVTVANRTYTVDFGSPVTLHCSVTSEPTYTKVYWSKTINSEDRIISPGQAGITGVSIGNPSMTILKATLFDAGTFKCVAENSVGIGYSLTTQVVVNGDIPNVKVGSTTYKTVYGKKVTITCIVTSYPPVTHVFWMRSTTGNITINSGSSRTLGINVTHPSLEITFPVTSDSGRYTCYAVNDVGSGNSETFLTVTGSIPDVQVKSTSYETVLGNSITLHCSASASPFILEVYWEKNASGLITYIPTGTEGFTGITVDNPSITINFATSSDSGMYTCFARNYIGLGSSEASILTVNGGLPVVTTAYDSISTGFGIAVSLKCSVYAQPVPYQIYWTKKADGRTVIINNGSAGIIGLTTENPSLTIQYPITKDSGLYTCFAANEVGISSGKSIHLTVTPLSRGWSSLNDGGGDDLNKAGTIFGIAVGALAALGTIATIVTFCIKCKDRICTKK